MQTEYLYTVEEWEYDEVLNENIHMYTLDLTKALDKIEELMDKPYPNGKTPREFHELMKPCDDVPRHYSHSGRYGYTSDFYVFKTKLD